MRDRADTQKQIDRVNSTRKRRYDPKIKADKSDVRFYPIVGFSFAYV